MILEAVAQLRSRLNPVPFGVRTGDDGTREGGPGPARPAVARGGRVRASSGTPPGGRTGAPISTNSAHARGVHRRPEVMPRAGRYAMARQGIRAATETECRCQASVKLTIQLSCGRARACHRDTRVVRTRHRSASSRPWCRRARTIESSSRRRLAKARRTRGPARKIVGDCRHDVLDVVTRQSHPLRVLSKNNTTRCATRRTRVRQGRKLLFYLFRTHRGTDVASRVAGRSGHWRGGNKVT